MPYSGADFAERQSEELKGVRVEYKLETAPPLDFIALFLFVRPLVDDTRVLDPHNRALLLPQR